MALAGFNGTISARPLTFSTAAFRGTAGTFQSTPSRVVLPEGQLRADGRVDALLDVQGGRRTPDAVDSICASRPTRTSLALAPWAQLPQLNGPVEGALHIDAAVTGSMSTPEAVFTVTGRDISAAGLQGVTVHATGRVAGDRAELSTFTVRVAGGTITARGQASPAQVPERSVWTGVSSIWRR